MTPHTDAPAVTGPHRPPEGSPPLSRDPARRESLDGLHRLVMSRSSRLRRLIGMGAPDIVVRNEMRMLRAAVEAMLEVGATVNAGAPADHLPSERRDTPNGALPETKR